MGDIMADNRRRTRRCAVKAVVRIECHKGSTGLGANLALSYIDLSEAGVGLIVTEKLEKGQEVEILISGAGVPKPIRRIGRVVWAAGGEEKPFAIGVAFDK